MELTIAKWGNSLAVRLPSRLARAAHLAEGATVAVTAVDGTLVLTPLRRRYKLAELLADWPEADPADEVDWGGPAGREAW